MAAGTAQQRQPDESGGGKRCHMGKAVPTESTLQKPRSKGLTKTQGETEGNTIDTLRECLGHPHQVHTEATGGQEENESGLGDGTGRHPGKTGRRST